MMPAAMPTSRPNTMIAPKVSSSRPYSTRVTRKKAFKSQSCMHSKLVWKATLHE